MASPAIEPSFDVEEFWGDLLSFIRGRSIIPVIGAELITVEREGVSLPLYDLAARQLLAQYRCSAEALSGAPGRALNEAVCILASKGRRVKDLYRPIHDIVKSLAESSTIPAHLRHLAAIRHFDLFVSATPDDMLARAIDAERFQGSRQTDQIEYAPKLSTERRRDFPAIPTSQYAAVFYLFGKLDASYPFFAIHDEDALEFPYALQSGNGPAGVFSELRRRHLLLLGRCFPDWMNRFFLRLSNEERLFSDRQKKEFLVGDFAAEEGLTTFVQRFSQDSRVYPVGAQQFVEELFRRWKEGEPPDPVPANEGQNAHHRPDPAIFLSYASEDIGPARQLAEEISTLAGDVAWFDKQALKPGDDWDRVIGAAVQRCGLFIALISKNTESRTEGYFRREWSIALQRLASISGRKLLFPLIIDAQPKADGSYELVPDAFRQFQFGHAPGGRMSPEFCTELSQQLKIFRRSRQS
jgi:hypothetical protein